MSNTDSVRIKVSHVIKTVDCGKDNTLAFIIHGMHLLTWLVLVNGPPFVDLFVCLWTRNGIVSGKKETFRLFGVYFNLCIILLYIQHVPLGENKRCVDWIAFFFGSNTVVSSLRLVLLMMMMMVVGGDGRSSFISKTMNKIYDEKSTQVIWFIYKLI